MYHMNSNLIACLTAEACSPGAMRRAAECNLDAALRDLGCHFGPRAAWIALCAAKAEASMFAAQRAHAALLATVTPPVFS